MAQNRETRLTLQGLVTQPSKYLAEPGSLAQAVNIMCRQPGLLEGRIGFENYKDYTPNNHAPRRLVETVIKGIGGFSVALSNTTDSLLTSYAELVFDATAGAAPIEDEAGDPFSSCGAVNVSRERVFLDSPPSDSNDERPQLVRAIDFEDDPLLARRAGLIPPSWIDAAPDTTYVGVAVPSAEWVAYQAHFERDHGDGYVQIGPVSPIVLAVADGSDRDIDLTVYWSAVASGNDWVREGDTLKVYRSDPVTTRDGVNSAALYLVQSVILTSTDITNRYATTKDLCPAANAGELLYTNSGQDGADGSRWFPPSARDIAVFRDTVWYASPFALRVAKLKVPGMWTAFDIGDAGRRTGVGSFRVTGTAVSGNAAFTASSVDAVVGLSVGQVVISDGSGAWTVDSTTITNISGTTVTMSDTSLVNGAIDFRVGDRLEINGAEYRADSPARLMRDIALRTGLSEESEHPAWLFANWPVFRNNVSTLDGVLENVELTFIAPSYSLDDSSRAPTLFFQATNQTKYSPALAHLSAVPAQATALGSDDYRLNRAYFSKISEPEAVPVLNYRMFGRGRLLRLIAVDDALFAFCTDGTYICTGDGINWDIRPFDLSLVLLHKWAVDVMFGEIWALTNRGVVVVSANGVRDVSTATIGNRIRALEETYASSFVVDSAGAFKISLTCDPYHREVWLRYSSSNTAGVTLVYNAVADAWTEVDNDTERPTALGYSSSHKALLLGQSRVNPGDYAIKQSLPDSNVTAAGRMAGAVVELNPFSGGDLNTRKQWLEAVWDLEILSAGQDLQVAPFFGSVAYNDYEISAPSGDLEHVVKVPRNAANGKQLQPGLEFSGSSEDSNAAPWRLSGVTVKFRVASPDTRRQ